MSVAKSVSSLLSRIFLSLVILLLASTFFAPKAYASVSDGTIDATDRYAWGENIGWVDFGSTTDTVHITDSSVTGSVYGENIGWIVLDPVGYGGVVNDAEGNLSGEAWGENIGWVDFSQVVIGADGVFSGQAYGENIGWITFGTTTNKVATDWRPSSSRITITGILYEENRTTPYATSTTVTIAVATSSIATSTVATYSTTTVATTGAFSFDVSVGEVATGTPITIYTNNTAVIKAVTVTKTASGTNETIANLPLYKNHVTIRNEGGSGTTTKASDLIRYDNTKDSDIQFSASSTLGRLTITNNQTLYVATGTTFDLDYPLVGHTFETATTATMLASSTMTLTGNYQNNGTFLINNASSTEWTSRNVPDAKWWQSVTYGNGLFVAVNQSGSATGAVMTSPDGITWTSRNVPDGKAWFSITYGNGLFVAVNNNGSATGAVMTSPDGITWTSRNVPDAKWWQSVTYGNGLFVAVNQSGSATGAVMTSPDGITWTSRNVPDAKYWNSVTYGNGLFVAVNSDGSATGAVMTSPDGITWTSRNVPDAKWWYSVTYGNGLFVAVNANSVATGAVMTSPDGITWTSRSVPDAKWWYGVTYGNGLFVAVNYDNSATGAVMTSPDGITWTSRNVPDAKNWRGITYGNGLFVAVNSNNSATGAVMNSLESLPLSLIGTTTQTLSGTMVATSTLPSLIFSEAGTKTFGSNASTSDITINTSSGSVTASTGLTITGGLTNSSTFNAPTNLYLTGGNQIITGTWTGTPNLIITGTGNKTFYTNATTSTSNLTINSGINFNAPAKLVVNGDYVNNSTITYAGVVWTTSTTSGNNGAWTSVTYGNGLFVAVSRFYTGSDPVMTSSDGINWATTTAAGDNDSWNSVTYGNGLFVAVANSGTNRVMTSSDGINWATTTAAGDNDSWNSVTYGNGLFVAVGGSSDHVITSPDGINWTVRSASNNTWKSVIYANNMFVAVACGYNSTNCNSSAGGSRIMTSPDGITWTDRSGGSTWQWYSVSYGNGLFVAGGYQHFMTSSDGINWAVTTDSFNTLQSIYYNNNSGLFIGVQSPGPIMSSSDGVIWTQYNAAGNDDNWTSVTYGNGRYVVVGDGGDERVMTSGTDLTFSGASAQSISGSMAGASALGNVAFTGAGTKTFASSSASSSNFTVEAVSGEVIAPAALTVYGNYTNNSTTTMAGAAWTSRNVPDAKYWYSVTYGNGLFVAVNYNNSATGAVMTSPDGITWTSRNVPDGKAWFSITYGNGLFVAVNGSGSATGAVMTSPDGITWTSRNVPDAKQWYSVTYGNGLFVAVNYSNSATGAVMTSPDGITWTSRNVPDAKRWISVTYGNGLFVAVNYSNSATGAVMTSPDGITWTSRNVPDAKRWISVTYGNGLFVAVNSNNSATGAVMTSPDGITWTSRNVPAAKPWSSVTYGNGLFVAVNNSGSATGAVMTSPDGITWTSRSVSDAKLWYGVTYGNGLFVAVNADGSATGAVMTSSDTSLWLAGASDQTLAGNLTGASALRDVRFSEAGTKTFANNASTTNFTIATSSATVTAPTILSVSGDFTNRSTFAPGSGTVILDGLNQTLSGTTTFNHLSKATYNHATTTFEAGALYTITGNLTFSGVNASTTHALRSSASGTQWYIDPQGTRTLSYLDVKDSNNINVSTVNCGTGCIDGTNNTNWSFTEGSEVATISLSENLHFYTGAATTTIGTITITEPATPTITSASDLRLTIATTTTNFRFNTNTTSLTFGGTASGKVNSTVSYADGGATLVIDVTTNFAADDTLTISGVKVGSFASVSTTTSQLALHTDGDSIGTPASVSTETIRITGSLLATNHTAGQVNNEFDFRNKADETLLAFNLEAVGENATVTDMVITLAGIQKVDSSNISDFKLYRDTNSDSTLDGGDILIDGSGILTINGQHGAITFSSDFLASTSANYIMTGDTNSINNGASVVFKLNSIGITALGATSNYSPYIINTVSAIQHNRHNSSGGGSSARVGDDAPPGDGVVEGGGEGSGGGAGNEQDGENIANDPNFFRPTATGGADNEWTNGSNGLVSDGVYATAASTALKQSYNGFNFGIPGGNTIQGIAVKLDVSGTTAAGTIDVSISWDSGNSYTTVKATPTLSGSDVVYTVGGASDTWGRSWTPSEFASDKFILRVAAQPSSNTIRLDALEVRVYHQTSGGGSGGGGGI